MTLFGIRIILSLFDSLTSIDFCLLVILDSLIYLLVHFIHHAVQLLLLVIYFHFRAVENHITTFDCREFGSAHGALEFSLTPFVDAFKAKLMAATIYLGEIVLAKANAALKN